MATIAEVWDRHELIGNLVVREIRSRYKQSILGVAWSVIIPLINTLLFSFVFNRVAGIDAPKNAIGQSIPYVLFAYIGNMFWNFFSTGVTSGTECITINLNLLTKVYFPREVFNLSNLAARAVDFSFSLVVFVALMAYGVSLHLRFSWEMLLTPVILLIQITLTLGLSLLLSTVNLFFRDVRFLIALVMQLWMFLTPVNYPLTNFLKTAQSHPLVSLFFFHLNPMTPLMIAYQHLILNMPVPAGLDLWGLVAQSAAISVLLLALGYRVFTKYEGSFAEAV